MTKTFARNFLIIALLHVFVVITAQKKKDIMYSQDITQIENFLKTSHPDDPRNPILKKRLVKIKNETWMKGNGNTNTITVPPTNKLVEETVPVNIINKTDQEFQNLIAQEQHNHKTKTVNLLNQMFNSDPTSKEVIVLVKNNSNCNMILKVDGSNDYNLPIYGHNENFMVIKKGNYHITSDVCSAKFEKIKNIDKSFVLTISNPTLAVSGSKTPKSAVMEK